MNMALPDFLLFTVVGVFSVYFPLFLHAVGYTATDIGILFGIFNAAGIVIPLLLTPSIAKSGHFSRFLLLFAAVMALIPLPLFGGYGFAVTALCMAVYATVYKCSIPVCDSLISTTLGASREKYGQVRVFGSAGFVAMSLIMQHFVRLPETSVREMMLWMIIPAILFGLSLLVRLVLTGAYSAHAQKTQEFVERHTAEDPDAHRSFFAVMRSFGGEYYLMLFVIFMQYMGMVPPNQFFSLYVKYGLHSDASGALWALNALCEIPFMFFSGRFIRRYGARRLLLICTGAVSVRMCCYAFIPSLAGAVLGQMMHSLTFGLFYPAAVLYCSGNGGKNRQAAPKSKKALMVSMSLFAAASGLASAIGAPAGGFIIDRMGYQALFLIFALFPVVALAVYGWCHRAELHR
jgi:MFS transporter, PPP family, 3-phenylpropionic acid transporter